MIKQLWMRSVCVCMLSSEIRSLFIMDKSVKSLFCFEAARDGRVPYARGDTGLRLQHRLRVSLLGPDSTDLHCAGCSLRGPLISKLCSPRA